MSQWSAEVRIPLAAGGSFTLCTCQTPEALAEVIRALVSTQAGGPTEYTISVWRYTSGEKSQA